MINTLLKQIRIVSDMVTRSQVEVILSQLQKVIDNQVSGEVVELGCNVGTMSLFIQGLLTAKTPKPYHVYDSFQGLPLPEIQDGESERFCEGVFAVTPQAVIDHFAEMSLPVPVIHKGWFKDQQYPEKICFAFFDGDLYSSIMDSWVKVYPKLTRGAIVCVHDYRYSELPGVETACMEFLKGRRYRLKVIENVGIFTDLV